MATRIYEIPAENFEALMSRIEKLSRRGKRHMVANPPTLRVLHEQDKPYCKDGETLFRRYVYVHLDGVAPTIDGWELHAVIDHTTDSDIGNIVRGVPGKTCPVQYRKAGSYCEHCKTHRRRNETFILSRDDVYMQVGRNCLADFCRDEDFADQLCGYAEWLSSIDELASESEGDEFSGNVKPRYLIEHVLRITSKVIRMKGWMSRGQAADREDVVATADIVSPILWDKKHFEITKNTSYEHIQFINQWNADDKDSYDEEMSEKVLAWVLSHREGDVESLSDYMYNLLVVCSQSTLSAKEFGLACSAVSSYMREVEKAARTARGASEHFGTIKVRSTWDAVITGIRPFASQFGTKYLVSFAVGDNQGVWWSSTDAITEFNVGDAVKITGSAKSHNEYRGAKQTELTRCKIAKVG